MADLLAELFDVLGIREVKKLGHIKPIPETAILKSRPTTSEEKAERQVNIKTANEQKYLDSIEKPKNKGDFIR